MTVFLMRHGATEWNLQGRFNSRTDVPLSAVGAAQVTRLGAGLAGAGIARILSSPSLRAIESARIVRAQLPAAVDVELQDALREMDFGDFEGQSREALQRQVEARACYAAWFDPDGAGVTPPGGESWAAAAQRAQQAMAMLERSALTTLVVGHGYLLRLMIVQALALGAPPMIRRLKLDNAHLSGLARGADGWRLLFGNLECLPDPWPMKEPT